MDNLKCNSKTILYNETQKIRRKRLMYTRISIMNYNVCIIVYIYHNGQLGV